MPGLDKAEAEKLYKALSGKVNLGTYDRFISKMGTTEERKSFYDVITNKYKLNIGDYDVYENRLKKKGSTESSDTKSPYQKPFDVSKATPYGMPKETQIPFVSQGEKPDKTVTAAIDQFFEKNKKVPWVKRILELDTRSIADPYNPKQKSTHLMASGEIDGKYYVYPEILDINGKLTYIPDLKQAISKGEAIEVANEGVARYIAENGYKNSQYWRQYETVFKGLGYTYSKTEPEQLGLTEEKKKKANDRVTIQSARQIFDQVLNTKADGETYKVYDKTLGIEIEQEQEATNANKIAEATEKAERLLIKNNLGSEAEQILTGIQSDFAEEKIKKDLWGDDGEGISELIPEFEEINKKRLRQEGYSQEAVEIAWANAKQEAERNKSERVFDEYSQLYGSESKLNLVLFSKWAVNNKNDINKARTYIRYDELLKKEDLAPEEKDEFIKLTEDIQKFALDKPQLYDPISGEKLTGQAELEYAQQINLAKEELSERATTKELLTKEWQLAGVTLLNAQKELYEHLKQPQSSGMVTTEGTPIMVDGRPVFSEYQKDTKRTSLEQKIREADKYFNAASQMLLLNESPLAVKTGFWRDVKESLNSLVVSAASTTLGEQAEKQISAVLPVTSREHLQAMEQIGDRAGVEWSEEEKEKFITPLSTEIVNGISGVFGLLPSLFLLNKATGALGVAKIITQIKNPLYKHLAGMVFEEVKMATVGFEPGAGAGFYVGGFIAPKGFLKMFPARYAGVQKMLETTIKTSITGTAGMQIAQPLEKSIDIAYGNLFKNEFKDWDYEFKQMYPDLSEAGRGVLRDFAINAVLGLFHGLPQLTSTKSPEKYMSLAREARQKAAELQKIDREALSSIEAVLKLDADIAKYEGLAEAMEQRAIVQAGIDHLGYTTLNKIVEDQYKRKTRRIDDVELIPIEELLSKKTIDVLNNQSGASKTELKEAIRDVYQAIERLQYMVNKGINKGIGKVRLADIYIDTQKALKDLVMNGERTAEIATSGVTGRFIEKGERIIRIKPTTKVEQSEPLSPKYEIEGKEYSKEEFISEINRRKEAGEDIKDFKVENDDVTLKEVEGVFSEVRAEKTQSTSEVKPEIKPEGEVKSETEVRVNGVDYKIIPNNIAPKPRPVDVESIKKSDEWVQTLFNYPDGTKIIDKNGTIYEILFGKLYKLTLDNKGNIVDSEIVYKYNRGGGHANPEFFNEGYKILAEKTQSTAEVKPENDVKSETEVRVNGVDYKIIPNNIAPKPRPVDVESIKKSDEWVQTLFNYPDGTKIIDKNGTIYEILFGRLNKLTLDNKGNIVDSETVYKYNRGGGHANPEFFNEGYKILAEKTQPTSEVKPEVKPEKEKSEVLSETEALKDVESTTEALKGIPKEKLREIITPEEINEINKNLYDALINRQEQLLKEGKKTEIDKDPEIISIKDNIAKTEKAINDLPKYLSEAYHKAKADGSNPELVKAVEKLLKAETKPEIKPEGEVKTEKIEPVEPIKPKSNENITTEKNTIVEPTIRTLADKTKTAKTTEEVERATAEADRLIAESGAKVGRLPIDNIVVAPKVMQFKAADTKAGTNVNERIPDTEKYSESSAGVILVWKDAKNELGFGKDAIILVDGHHRMDFAKRKGQSEMNVLFVEANTAKEARLEGAFANIRQGRGTAIDAAKIYREASPEQIETFKPTSLVARQGRQLANLAPELFELLTTGKLDIQRALAISEVKNTKDQIGLYRMVTSGKKKLTIDGIKAMANEINEGNVPKKKNVQETLFGTNETEEILLVEKANLIGKIKSELAKDAKILASANKNKEVLEKAGNVIAVEENVQLSQEAKVASGLFETFKNRKSIQDILTKATEDLSKAKESEKKAIREKALKKVKEAINKELDSAMGKQEVSKDKKADKTKVEKTEPLSETELANRRKAEKEYNKELEDLDTRIKQAERSKQKKLDELNKKVDLFAGEGEIAAKGGGLFELPKKQQSPEDIAKILEPYNKEIERLKAKRQELINNKEKYLDKYKGQLETPDVTKTTAKDYKTSTTQTKVGESFDVSKYAKAEEAKAKIAEGFEKIAEAFGAIKKIHGDKAVKLFEGIMEVADGLYDISIINAKELINKLKQAIRDKFQGAERRELIKLINQRQEDIARGFYFKKEPNMSKSDLQKQIDKAVEGSPKYSKDYNDLKKKYMYPEGYKAGEKAGKLTEREDFNKFLNEVKSIVEEAKVLGEISVKDANKILSEIEKTTKFKTDKTTIEKRQKALKNIEKMINQNVYDTTKDRIVGVIDRAIVPKTVKDKTKLKGKDLAEWDFKKKANKESKNSELLENIDKLSKDLEAETDPDKILLLEEKMQILEYANNLRRYKSIKDKYEDMNLEEKRDALIELNELSEYFKTVDADFIIKSKEKREAVKEENKNIINNLKKGAEGNERLARKELVNDILADNDNIDNIIYELAFNLKPKYAKKIKKNKAKLSKLNKDELQVRLQELLGVELEYSSPDAKVKKQKGGWHPMKSLENLDGIFESVFGRGGRESYEKVKHILDNIHEGRRRQENFAQKAKKLKKEALNTLSKEVSNNLFLKQAKLGISITKPDGKVANELSELSYMQVAAMATELKDPYSIRGMETYRSYEKLYGEEGTAKIKEHIDNIVKNTPSLKEFIAKQENFYKELYNDINQVYREMYNMDMPNHEGYIPRSVLDYVGEYLGGKTSRYISPSAIKKTTGKGTIDISKDAIEKMDKYIKEMSDFVGFAQAKKEFVYFMSNKEVRKSVKRLKGGDKYLKIIDTYMDNIPNVKRMDNHMIDKAINNIAFAPLSLNITMFPKQAASMTNFATDMVYDAVWKNIPVVAETIWVKRLLDPRGWGEYATEMFTSPFIKERLERGHDRDFQLYYEKRLSDLFLSKMNASKKMARLTQIIESDLKGGAVKWGDIAAFLGGKPLYYETKRRLAKENPNMSEAELRAKAMEKVGSVGELKQQSANPENLSYFQMASPASRFIKYFTTPLQYQQRVNKAIRNLTRAIKNPQDYTKTEVLTNVRELYTYMITANLVFYWVDRQIGKLVFGYEDEEEPEARNKTQKIIGQALEFVGKGIVQGVPLAGDIAEYFGRKLQGKQTYSLTTSNAIERTEDIISSWNYIYGQMVDKGKSWDELTDREREKVTQGIAKTSEVSGWGVENIRKMYNRIVFGSPNPAKEALKKEEKNKPKKNNNGLPKKNNNGLPKKKNNGLPQ